MERYHRLDRKAHAIILSYHYPSRNCKRHPLPAQSPPVRGKRNSRTAQNPIATTRRREYSVLIHNRGYAYVLCINIIRPRPIKAVFARTFTRQADAYAAAP